LFFRRFKRKTFFINKDGSINNYEKNKNVIYDCSTGSDFTNETNGKWLSSFQNNTEDMKIELL